MGLNIGTFTETKMLCFANAQWNDNDCSSLCHVIMNHPEIQWINLSGNIIGDLGTHLLMSTLRGRPMQWLDLRDNLISDKTLEPLLSKDFIKIDKNDPQSFEAYVEELYGCSNPPIEKISASTYQRTIQEAKERVIAAVEHSIHHDKRAFEVEENNQRIIDDFRENLRKGPRYERVYDEFKKGWYHRVID